MPMKNRQSAVLLAVKMVAVGGLGYVHLTQLLTTAEIERRKSIKGKRAITQLDASRDAVEYPPKDCERTSRI
jgi:hypothetical protein